MKFLRLSIMLSSLVLIAGCTGKKDDGILLRLSYNPSDEQMLVYRSSTTASNMFSGSMIISTYSDCKLKITDIDKYGFIDVSVDLEKLRIETFMDNEWESYDSGKDESQMTPTEKEQHRMSKEMLDSPMKYTITELGRINTPLRLSNGDNAEGAFELGFVQLEFPEEKVSEGSEWTFERYISKESQKIIFTNTVKKITDQTILIRTEAELPDFSNLPKPTTAYGEYALDRKTCRVMEGKISMNIEGGTKSEISFTLKNIEP